LSQPTTHPDWSRIAGLRPRLAAHAQIQRQTFRGQLAYVLHNPITGRFYRFSPGVQHFTGLMDGKRSVQELLTATNEALGEDAVTQQQVVELLGKLNAAEVLQSEAPVDVVQLFQRHTHHRRSQWLGKLKNPLAIRLPLFDPDALLERLLPLGRFLFSRLGAWLWLLVVGLGLVLTLTHWAEIKQDSSIELLSPHNLFLLGLCYPLIKALHELGHGLATKVWGGEVHETGIILMALIPLPYVDASTASAFPEKRRRMLVGAAGIMVEMFLAALALLLWLNTEPGLVHSLAYNTMLIGSISTLFFNANPLLRFDGYYVLSDAIGMPNLATRSTRYLGYLVQRYLFGLSSLTSPATAPDEWLWLGGYGVLAYLYRLFILVVIILFVAESYPVVGVLIAAWATLTQIIMPVWKHAYFLLTSPRLKHCRARVVSACAALLVSPMVFLLAVPVPLSTMAEGVVVPPDDSELRAGTDAVITRLLADPDTEVIAGQALIETEDPFLSTELQIFEARLKELNARRSALRIGREQVKADMLAEEIKLLKADLQRSRERARSLVVRSPAQGVFLLEQPGDMPGRFIRQGDRLGYVADLEHPTVRVAVTQANIGVVRTWTEDVSVRFAERMDIPIRASIHRVVPAAQRRLPSPALGPLGGGPFAVDPEDPEGILAAESFFEIELTLPVAVSRLGERVYVRFDHGNEPLAWQWYRRIRQLFLKRFNV
jgi:putative peptide zinc metalloprotease protein